MREKVVAVVTSAAAMEIIYLSLRIDKNLTQTGGGAAIASPVGYFGSPLRKGTQLVAQYALFKK
jgi:hypothetical protein